VSPAATDPGKAATCFVDAAWVGTEREFPVTDPATGAVVGAASDAGDHEVERAVGAAAHAFPGWAMWTAAERGAALRRISAALLEDAERIADVITAEQGKPRAQAAWEVRYATEWVDWFAEEGRRAYGRVVPATVPGKRLLVLRQPLGVAAAITPWNFPVAMIARKLAPALAAGCTLVVKPAEQTPLSAVAMFEAIERADIPPGVANLVTTDRPEAVGGALVEDPRVRKITFTGSTEVGKVLVRASATNLARVSLELGGQAPFVVFDDADLDAAVQGVIASKFQVNGQSCLCANRVYVQSGVREEFAGRLAEAVGTLVLGPGAEPASDVGPLIDDRAFAKVASHVEDAVSRGATVAVGGERRTGGAFDGGYFFEPTLLAGCTDTMLVAREETFGPIAPILEFADEGEVVGRANDTAFGLAAYFYTRDLGRALRVAEGLEYGIVGVNDPRPASPSAPFGGFKQSGLGREGGQEGLDAFLETKLVSIAY
jgi:succinate-semialdehyde dehydrogenase/glutarate-semialdehyde dehydrogenase